MRDMHSLRDIDKQCFIMSRTNVLHVRILILQTFLSKGACYKCTEHVLCKQNVYIKMLALGGHQLATPLYSGVANPLTSHFSPGQTLVGAVWR